MELHEAIREICSRYGVDYLQKDCFYNMLSDFQAFKSFPVCKTIVKTIFAQNYGSKILSVYVSKEDVWQSKIQQYTLEIVSNNGFQENLVSYIFQSIAFGIGWTDIVPDNPQMRETASTPTLFHSASSRLSEGNQQKYNPKSDLSKFVNPSADLFDEDNGCEYHMRRIFESEQYNNCDYQLPVCLGYDENHEIQIVDLTKLSHLLVAGSTGQGKSTWLHTVLASLLCTKHPSELKLVLIDMSRLEFNFYSPIECHYLAKTQNSLDSIITDTKQAVSTLNSLCSEMDSRYELLKIAEVRNIREYNLKYCDHKLSPSYGHRFLPYITIIIDEYADLIFFEGKEAENPLTRLARLGCSIGIHMIITTKCIVSKIISNNIKSCFPSKIAFRVPSLTESRLIIDIKGAEKLHGDGDFIFTDGRSLLHIQSPYISSDEIRQLARYIHQQSGYPNCFILPEYPKFENETEDDIYNFDTIDPLFMDAATLIVQSQLGSTSHLQRSMNLGYNRAGRLMDQLEKFGIVGSCCRSGKPREVKVKTTAELKKIFQIIGLL